MEKRTIKFRVWDSDSKVFRLGDYSLGVKSSEIRSIYGDVYSGLIPMQFTGLFDKLRKEIYEGDITDSGETVLFENGAFRTSFECNRQGSALLTEKRTSLLQIIGNIHENPELL